MKTIGLVFLGLVALSAGWFTYDPGQTDLVHWVAVGVCLAAIISIIIILATGGQPRPEKIKTKPLSTNKIAVLVWTILQVVSALLLAADLFYAATHNGQNFNIYWGMPLLIWVAAGVKYRLRKSNPESITVRSVFLRQFWAKGIFPFIASLFRLAWGTVWIIIFSGQFL